MFVLPHFPRELRHRLTVQTYDVDAKKWVDSRPATLDDLIAVLHEVPTPQHQQVERALNLVPDDIAAQLKELETVIDSVRDHAKEALRRIDEYRETYPRRDYGVIDCEFPEVEP